MPFSCCVTYNGFTIFFCRGVLEIQCNTDCIHVLRVHTCDSIRYKLVIKTESRDDSTYKKYGNKTG